LNNSTIVNSAVIKDYLFLFMQSEQPGPIQNEIVFRTRLEYPRRLIGISLVVFPRSCSD